MENMRKCRNFHRWCGWWWFLLITKAVTRELMLYCRSYSHPWLLYFVPITIWGSSSLSGLHGRIWLQLVHQPKLHKAYKIVKIIVSAYYSSRICEAVTEWRCFWLKSDSCFAVIPSSFRNCPNLWIQSWELRTPPTDQVNLPEVLHSVSLLKNIKRRMLCLFCFCYLLPVT